MKHIFYLVKKNLKLLLRARASAFIVILAPLLIIFLAGLAFNNTGAYRVTLGTYAPQYNDLVNSFVAELENNQFEVTKYNNETECVDGITSGKINSCLVFAEAFSLSSESNTITFYVDHSRINLVGTILDTVSSKISVRSAALSKDLAGNVLNALSTVEQKVNEKKPDIVALTTDNDNALRIVADVRGSLAVLDVSFDPAKFNTTALETTNAKTLDEIDDVFTDIDSRLADVHSILGGVQSYTDGSIYSDLASARSKLNDISDIIVSSEQNTAKSLQELSGMTTSLIADVNSIQSKLEGASSAKASGVSSLDQVKGMLDSSVLKLTSIQSGFNEIQDAISKVEIRDAETISAPIETIIKPVVTERTHLDYLFPILVALVIMFTSILLAPTLIMIENKSSAYFRNAISPVRDSVFIFSTFLTVFIILVVQVAIILLIGGLVFKLTDINLLSTVLASLLLIATFTFLGMTVGYVFKTEQTAAMGAIFVGTVFLFLSDVILPLESMPQTISQIASYNPFVFGADLLRRAVVFNESISTIYLTLLIALAYVAVSAILAVVVYQLSMKKSASKK